MAVITVSRQFGSGAMAVVNRVCEVLNYHYFDKETIAQVAADVGLAESDVLDFSEEHYKGKRLMDRLFRPGPYTVAEVPAWVKDPSGTETQTIKRLDRVEFTNLIRGVILEVYKRGNVVIVGRGGQVILGDRPDVLHVRIEAPAETRLGNVQKQANCGPGVAHEMIMERDRAVGRYLGEIFNIRPDDPNLYHLIINMGKWTTEAAAQVIVSAVQQLPV